MEKKAQRNFLWIALLVLGTIWILARHNRTQPYYTINGLIFGTVYNITYQYDGDLKVEIDEELKRFDGSLSPFNDTATITLIIFTVFTTVLFKGESLHWNHFAAFICLVLAVYFVFYK